MAAALGHPLSTSTTLQQTNDTLNIARSKAIDMRFHWLRDRVREGQIRVIHLPGEMQLANFFTKALPIWQNKKQMTQFVRISIRGCVEQ